MIRRAENTGPSRGRGGRHLPFAIVLLFALGMSGCGLDSVVYTNIPAPTFSYSGGSLFLQDQGGVDTSLLGHTYVFLGYQILYRIYDTSDAAASASNAISVLASSGQSPDTVYSQLTTSNKLVPLYFSNIDTSESVLPATSSDNSGVSFLISTSNWSVTKSSGTFPTGSVVAYRNYTGSLSGRKTSFVTPDRDIKSGDSDYAGASDDPSSPYVVMCAVGIASIDIFNHYYSLPMLLQNGPLTLGN